MRRESQFGTDRGPRQNAGAASGVALAILLAASPVHADLPPAIDAILAACLAEGLTHAERVAAAPGAGWGPLPVEAHGPVALALAPWDLLRRLGLDGVAALSADALAGDLDLMASRTKSYLAAPATLDHWFALPDGSAYARMVDALGGGQGTSCELVAAVGAGDLARHLDLPLRRVEGETLELALIDLPAAPGDRGAIVTHLRLMVPDPAAAAVIVTPRLPRPAPSTP